jgi:seryl-tRNA(Sec) selenium transferase
VVSKVINAQARASKIGSSLMHAEVPQAMAEAAGSFVDMAELLRKGAHIAELIGVEAVLIVNSAAAGLTAAASRAAILTRSIGCPARGA